MNSLSNTDVPQAIIDEIGGASAISGYTLNDAGSGQLDVDADSTGAFGGTTFLDANDASATAASGDITFDGVATEGSSITIGDETIGFYNSSLENYANDSEAIAGLETDFAIDVANIDNADGMRDAVIGLEAGLAADVSLSSGGTGQVNIDANATGTSGNSINLEVSEDTTTGFEANFQIGANQGQSMTINVSDMRASALGISGETAGDTADGVGDKAAGAVFTEIQNVTDGTDDTSTEYALDVSSHEKASAAVETINQAIEEVSSQRSELGAYQNRLEHTISNLDNSSENLSAAESRIRDVDMAEEMMEMTRSNILSQASQSMLAQANQRPQSVLQLLG
ncbi:flagellin [Alteribacillus persepolensis]|uniref:flagellin n=1 Tax=Alteribacillus persepolensis TaxID=568899 RepID=UPI002481BB9A|nr:flagellin [Alteribacillus persepolensis]